MSDDNPTYNVCVGGGQFLVCGDTAVSHDFVTGETWIGKRMSDESMVKRVAAAIFGGLYTADDQSEEDFEDVARAAIAAIRTPTERMIEAGELGVGNPIVDPAWIWQKMIDAALE